MPRLKDIARALDVSPSTVSNVLAGKGRTSADLARRVREEAHRLGYAPGGAGRALKTGRSGVIGLVVPDLAHPLFPRMTQAIERAATDAGYGMLVADSHGDVTAQREAIMRLAGRGADGVILIPRRGAPAPDGPDRIVILDSPTTPGNAICADHRGGGAGIARHLRAQGHGDVVLVGETAASPVQSERIAGMRQELEPGGAARVVWHDDEGDAAVIEAVRDGATAVACTSDLLALTLMGSLGEAGLTVPRDVSVTGFDDLFFAGAMRPGLTTMAADQAEIAGLAVATLVALIEGAEPPAPRTVPMTLIPRATTALPTRQETTTC